MTDLPTTTQPTQLNLVFYCTDKQQMLFSMANFIPETYLLLRFTGINLYFYVICTQYAKSYIKSIGQYKSIK